MKHRSLLLRIELISPGDEMRGRGSSPLPNELDLPMKMATMSYPMERISYTESREARLLEAMRRVCSSHEPIIIQNLDEPSVVLLSLEDYEALRSGNQSPEPPC